jgi:hypothetical protein
LFTYVCGANAKIPSPELESLSRTHALPGDKNTYLEPYNGVFNVNWGWDSSF